VRALPDGALDFIIRHEGIHKRAYHRILPYHDPVGFPTIGIGHLLSRVAWEDLKKYPDITEDEARALGVQDTIKAQASVLRQVRVPLSDNQVLALDSFVFNLGGGALQISALLRILNRGEYEAAADQFLRWVYAGLVKLPGLVRRRREERELFLS